MEDLFAGDPAIKDFMTALALAAGSEETQRKVRAWINGILTPEQAAEVERYLGLEAGYLTGPAPQ